MRLDPDTSRSFSPGLVFGFRSAHFDMDYSGSAPLLTRIPEFQDKVAPGAQLAFSPRVTCCSQRLVEANDTRWRAVLSRYPLRDHTCDLGPTIKPFRLGTISIADLDATAHYRCHPTIVAEVP